MQVLRGLLKGVREGRTRTAYVVDLMPYDGTLPLAVSRGVPDDDIDLPGITGHSGVPEAKRRKKDNARIDHIGCASVIWAGANRDEFKQVRDFISDRLEEDLKVGIRTGNSNLPEAAEVPPVRTLESFSNSTKVPELDESKFKHTKPLADLTLPVLQSVHDEIEEMEREIQLEFEELVSSHNREFNPSGRAFKDRPGMTDDKDPETAPADSVALVSGPDDPATKDDLIAKFGPENTIVLPGSSSGFEMVAVRDGQSDKFAKLLVIGSWWSCTQNKPLCVGQVGCTALGWRIASSPPQATSWPQAQVSSSSRIRQKRLGNLTRASGLTTKSLMLMRCRSASSRRLDGITRTSQ